MKTRSHAPHYYRTITAQLPHNLEPIDKKALANREQKKLTKLIGEFFRIHRRYCPWKG